MVTIVVSKMTNIICTRLPVGWTLYVESTIWGHYEIKFRDHAVSNLSDWFILYNCPLNAWIGVLPSEGLPVDRSRIKQAFLSLPIAEAFQHLFLDQNIEQGWSYTLKLLLAFTRHIWTQWCMTVIIVTSWIQEQNQTCMFCVEVIKGLHYATYWNYWNEVWWFAQGSNHKVTSQGFKVTLIGCHCVERTYSAKCLFSY